MLFRRSATSITLYKQSHSDAVNALVAVSFVLAVLGTYSDLQLRNPSFNAKPIIRKVRAKIFASTLWVAVNTVGMQVVDSDQAHTIPIATTTILSQSLAISFTDNSLINTHFEDFQTAQKSSFWLKADGKERRFAWEVVSNIVNFNKRAHPDHEACKGMGKRPVLRIESKRRKEIQPMVGMKLVDNNEQIWASYVHNHDTAYGVQSTGESGIWGTVGIRCRAVILDEGVDQAFVVLISVEML